MRPRPPRLRPQWLMCQDSPLSLPSLSSRPSLPSTILKPIGHNNQQNRTIRSIEGKKPSISRHNQPSKNSSLPTLGATPLAALERRRKTDSLPLRTGVLAIKKGMTGFFNPETGTHRPCTVLQMDRVQIVANKWFERHGYFAVCVGEGWRKPENIGRAMMGLLSKSVAGSMGKSKNGRIVMPEAWMEEMKDEGSREEAHDGVETGNETGPLGLPPKKEIREFKVRDEKGLLPIGTTILPTWFQVGQFVDTRSHTRGKGFAGVMKRHNMKGQPASHGVSKTHRSLGSAGGGQGSGSRVHPGKRMAGNMGGQRHTLQNLEVIMIDEPNGIVVVNGCVSGPKGCLVMIQDALKKPWPVITDPNVGIIRPGAVQEER